MLTMSSAAMGRDQRSWYAWQCGNTDTSAATSGRRCSLSGCAATFWRQLDEGRRAHHDNDPAGVHDRLCVLPEANREEGRIQAARAEDVVHNEVVLLVLRYRALLPAPGGALGTLSDKGHAVLHADAPDACLVQAKVRLGGGYDGRVIFCRQLRYATLQLTDHVHVETF